MKLENRKLKTRGWGFGIREYWKKGIMEYCPLSINNH
jgi:hypothetical protein